MRFFSKKKYIGVDSRMGGSDRRFPGKWSTHIWGIILLLVFLAGNGVGINLRADDDSVALMVADATEGDIVRSQVILDSLISLASRDPVVQERVVVSTELVHDTTWVVDTLLVPQEPQIIRVVEIKEVLVIDTVFAPPQIITIPAPDRGYFSSHYFLPRAGNLLYLLGGVALGSILDNDASACIFISTDGTVRENCDPKR
jgi:hypothetical protein